MVFPAQGLLAMKFMVAVRGSKQALCSLVPEKAGRPRDEVGTSQ